MMSNDVGLCRKQIDEPMSSGTRTLLQSPELRLNQEVTVLPRLYARPPLRRSFSSPPLSCSRLYAPHRMRWPIYVCYRLQVA